MIAADIAKSLSNKDRRSSMTLTKLQIFAGTLLHGVLLLIPIFSSQILHSSDSLWLQIPVENSVDASGNYSDVAFGIRKFSTWDLERVTRDAKHVTFSDEQEDALGRYHNTAHWMFHMLDSFLWITLLAPVVVYLHRRFFLKGNKLHAASRLANSLARTYIPIMMLWTLLMLVPFFLLSKSRLCGPTYIELGYEEDIDASSSDECGNYEIMGTYATINDEMTGDCELGTIGICFMVLQWLVLLTMTAHAYFLSQKGDSLERMYQLEAVLDRRDFSVDTKAMDEESLDDEESIMKASK